MLSYTLKYGSECFVLMLSEIKQSLVKLILIINNHGERNEQNNYCSLFHPVVARYCAGSYDRETKGKGY